MMRALERWVTGLVILTFPETSEEKIISKSVDCGSSYSNIMGPTIRYYK